MQRRNVSEHAYLDQEDDGYGFEVYETDEGWFWSFLPHWRDSADEGWFWSFLPHWRDSGPYLTREEAIASGEKFIDVDGEPYIQY